MFTQSVAVKIVNSMPCATPFCLFSVSIHLIRQKQLLFFYLNRQMMKNNSTAISSGILLRIIICLDKSRSTLSIRKTENPDISL